jgi:O-antigen/teichoic acid export membrane protein
MSLLSRLSVLPGSIVSTLFPALTSLHSRSEWQTINDYFLRSQRYIVIILAPILFTLYAWAPIILRLWISVEFSMKAAGAMRILIVGFAFGLFAPIVGTMLEAKGRPDVLAKVYLVELPFNVLVVVLFTRYGGLWGAAASFTVRTILETLVLWVILYRTDAAMSARLLARDLVRLSPMILGLLVAASFVDGRAFTAGAVSTTVCLVSAWCAFSWFIIMDSVDRRHVLSIRKFRGAR